MEFGLSSEQILLQDSANRFLSEQVPLEKVRHVASGESDDAAIWAGLTDLGIPGLLVSEKNGGLGLSSLDAIIVAELLGYHVTPSPYVSSAVMAPVALQQAGIREDLLDTVATGETRIGVGFAEGVGARLDAGVTFKEGRLDGKSLFVLDANADHYLVANNQKHLYLVDVNSEGVS
jgi:alkylation response protein AidB-like acyl-CoA dehydrogenase